MRRLSIVLAPLLALALVVSTGASALARPTHENDAHDAPYAFDTREVRLYQDFHGFLVVQMYSRTYHVGPHFNGLDVRLDTRGSTAADYEVRWSFGGDGDGYTRFTLYRANGSDLVAPVSCPGLTGRGRKKVKDIEVQVPVSCLVRTKRVGVKTTTWDYTRYRDGVPVKGRTDAAPNHGWLR